MIVDIFDSILGEMEKLGLPGRLSLNPGLAQDEYEGMMSLVGLAPPASHSDLYRKCNGLNETMVGPGICLFPDFAFPSLSRASSSYRGLAEGLCAAPLDHWQAHWFPVFWDMAGSYYLMAMNPSKRDYEAIYLLMPAFETKLVFASLAVMLNAVLACYQNHVFSYQEGELLADYDAQQEVFRKYRGY